MNLQLNTSEINHFIHSPSAANMSFEIPLKKKRTIDDELQVAKQREARMQQKYIEYRERYDLQKSVNDKLAAISELDKEILAEETKRQSMVSKITQL